ncbi:MAG TPA: peptidoglycan-binding protein [Acidimicrobiales bacterium]|nr:peptidoglycan-binding protein [Acidimicrobiales bacterium]
MRDLQHRLAALGVGSIPATGAYDLSTAAAVRTFQTSRGLPASGVCDDATWEALVEAGWRLGDRPLYRGAPMLRGDDVADLQSRLGAIGFDPGWVDGIFGPQTERALVDFQRNYGLVADAICGPATVGALEKLGDRLRATSSIVDVRQRERFLCGSQSLAGHAIVVAHSGALDALATSVARAITAGGGRGLVLSHPVGSAIAASANDAGADACLAFTLAAAGSTCRVAYYRSPSGWESQGGRRLAEILRDGLATIVPCAQRAVVPASVPLLRETRMPAVVVELAAAHDVVARTGDLAAAIPGLLDRWIAGIAGAQ